MVDICRRAGIETDMISIDQTDVVAGSHGIAVRMDRTLDQTNFGELDILILPGGKLGTQNLEGCKSLMEQLDAFYRAGKWIAAICAAPSIFGHRGYLKGRMATSYPTFEGELYGAQVTGAPAVTDGNVITGRGMGCAIAFGLEIVKQLESDSEAEKLADSIVYEG